MLESYPHRPRFPARIAADLRNSGPVFRALYLLGTPFPLWGGLSAPAPPPQGNELVGPSWFSVKRGVSSFSSSSNSSATSLRREPSKMEPLAVHPGRCSGPKARVFAVLLSMVLCTAMLFLLQLKFLKPRIDSFYTFEVKDAKGRPVSLEKFKGKVSCLF